MVGDRQDSLRRDHQLQPDTPRHPQLASCLACHTNHKDTGRHAMAAMELSVNR